MFNQNRKHGESQVMQELVYQQDELVKERQKHRALKNLFLDLSLKHSRMDDDT